MTGIELLAQVARASPPTPGCCCSRRTPTPTSPSGRSTTSGSTTTCSSRGTRPRASSTRSSTTCSRPGARTTPTRSSVVRVVGHRWSRPQLRREDVPRAQPRPLPRGSTSSATRRPAGCSTSPAPTTPTCRWCCSPRATRCATRPASSWPTRSGCAPGPSSRSTTCASSAAGRPGSRPPCTRRPRGCARSWSSATPPAARPGRAPRSRTTSASPRASRAPTSPTGPSPRRRASAPRWCSPARSSGSSSAARCTRCASPTAARSRPAPCSSRPASPTGGSRPAAPTSWARAASTTAPRPARRAQCADQVVHVVGAANSAGQAVLNFAKVRQAGRAARARRPARGLDVGVPRRADQGRRQRRGALPHRGRRRRTATDHLESVTLADRDTGHRDRRGHQLAVRLHRRARPAPTGSATPSSATRRGSSSPGPTCSCPSTPGGGRSPAAPYALETSVPGVFAAGDVRLDSMKRVASAVGEGAMSVYLVHRYLASV